MMEPVLLTSSTAANISVLISGFSTAMISPRSTKFSVALSTAATKTWALFDLPFFLDEVLEDTKVVTCMTRGSNVFSTVLVFISRFFGFHFSVKSDVDILNDLTFYISLLILHFFTKQYHIFLIYKCFTAIHFYSYYSLVEVNQA